MVSYPAAGIWYFSMWFCSLLLLHVYFCPMTLIICPLGDDSLAYISDRFQPLHLLFCSAHALCFRCMTNVPLDKALPRTRSPLDFEIHVSLEDFIFSPLPLLQGPDAWTFWFLFLFFGCLRDQSSRAIPLKAYLCVYNIDNHIPNLRYQAMCLLEGIPFIHGYYAEYTCDDKSVYASSSAYTRAFDFY